MMYLKTTGKLMDFLKTTGHYALILSLSFSLNVISQETQDLSTDFDDPDLQIPESPLYDRAVKRNVTKPNTGAYDDSVDYEKLIDNCNQFQRKFLARYPNFNRQQVTVGTARLSSTNANTLAPVNAAFNSAYNDGVLKLQGVEARIKRAFSSHTITAHGDMKTDAVTLHELREKMNNAPKTENIFSKAKRYLHAYMDEKLKEKGAYKNPDITEMQLQGYIDSIQAEQAYTDIIREYINAFPSAGTELLFSRASRAGACVVLLKDNVSTMFADLVSANVDISFPAWASNASLETSIPDHLTPVGKAQLMGRFGTELFIDKDGRFQVIAYGMSDVERNNSIYLEAAKTDAEVKAKANMCDFLSGTLTRETEIIEKVLLQDYVGSDSVDLSERRDRNINFIRECDSVLDGYVYASWSTPEHPLTDSTVMGAIYVWSPPSRFVF